MFSGFGLNVQLTPASAPPHEKVTEPATELVDFTDRLNAALPFTLITADTGEVAPFTPLRVETGGGAGPSESPLRKTSGLRPEFPRPTEHALPLPSIALSPPFAVTVGALA